MRYIILGISCLVLSIITVSLVLLAKNNNTLFDNNELKTILTETDGTQSKINQNKVLKEYNKSYKNNILNIENMLNGTFFIHNQNIYCIGRLYEKSPIVIISVFPKKEFISKIDKDNYILEDVKYLDYFDGHHYFISVNAQEYFDIWKSSNDTNPNFKIYQTIIKLDNNFNLIDMWNVTDINGLKLNKQEKNWKKCSSINDYKIKFLYDQDNFTVIEGDLKNKTFKFLYSDLNINKKILNKIEEHTLKKKPYIRGGIPVIEKDCFMYFINHQQVIVNNDIHYRLFLTIYDKEFKLKDNILFDSIFNLRVEYPTSAFIIEDDIYISFGVDDKSTFLYKIDLYDLTIKENAKEKNNKINNLFININNETLIFDN